jgi:hypothetical protein
MKRLFFLAIIGLPIFFATAFGQKTIMDQHAQLRNVGPFDAVTVSGAFEVVIIQDSNQAVVVSATDESLRNLIETEVREGTLYIGLKKSNIDWRGGRKFRAYIAAPTLRKLDIGGYSNMQMEQVFKASQLEVTISGSSDFHGHIECEKLLLTSSGSSDFHLKGKAEKLSINASGNSDLKAYGMAVDYCDITCSGNSNIEITMNKEMTVNVSGGSKVNYKGTGVVKEFNASGKSSLNKLD